MKVFESDLNLKGMVPWQSVVLDSPKQTFREKSLR